MKGRIVLRSLRRGPSYESYVKFDGKWVYLGQFPSEDAALQAQAQAVLLLERGGQWTRPSVPKVQIEDDGIQPRILVDGTVVFDITVSLNCTKLTAKSFPNKDVARAARVEWLDHLNRGDSAWRPKTQARPKQKPLGATLKMDPAPSHNITFAKYAYRWHIARKRLWAKPTLYGYRSAIKRFVNPVLGEVAVTQIEVKHLKSLDARMAEDGVGKKRRTKIRRALTKILHSTITDGLRTSHPASYAWCREGSNL